MTTIPRSARAAAAIACVLLTGAPGCNAAEPKNPTLVQELRVLAVKAEPPEVGPGDSVELEVLAVDPEGRDITIEWWACVQPEPGFGLFGAGPAAGASGSKGYAVLEDRTCADPDALLGHALGTGTSATLEVPDDLFDDDGLWAQALGLPEDLPLPDGAIDFLLAVAGVNMTVFVRASVEGEVEEAIKRVNVSLSGDPNENPADVAFDLVLIPDGVDELPEPADATPPTGRRCFVGEQDVPAVVSTGDYQITALNVPDPPPTYPVLVGGETGDDILGITEIEEDLFYSFFTTAGDLGEEVIKSARERAVTWHIGAEDSQEPIAFWVVIRDGRGGTEWCASEVAVVP